MCKINSRGKSTWDARPQKKMQDVTNFRKAPRILSRIQPSETVLNLRVP
jgi:hypothetical protein